MWTLAHMEKCSATSQTPAYKGLKKGEDHGREGERLPLSWLGDSFLWVMDREAGARMSGHHWTGLIS